MAPRPHVLVVDDDPDMLEWSCALLDQAGYSTTPAVNGEHALDTLRRARFDLVLTDLQMPGRDGASLLDAIVGAGLDVPVVIMSGAGTIERAISLVRAGAAGFVEKPYAPDTLMKEISRALHLRPSHGPRGEYGRLRVTGRLGAGGMAEVYAAEDPQLGRAVAIKVLRFDDRATTEERAASLARFDTEARTLARLSHPNISTIYDFGRRPSDGTPYIVMELVHGPTLRERLEREGPLHPEEVRKIALQLVHALGAVHSAGIVHRDLKPANMIGARGVPVRLVDFGIALTPARLELTDRNKVLGTARYLSPEAALGHEVDFRADQFALGAVLYELLTGKPAFDAPTIGEILRRIVTEVAPPSPLIPATLRAIIDRLLAKHPAARYLDERELFERLSAPI